MGHPDTPTPERRPRQRKQPTPDEREQRAAEQRALIHERMTDAIESLRSEAGFRAWLAARRRFHDYSLTNLLLIVTQRPDATQVAGYGSWQKLGYQVRRGERGIVIRAPMTIKRVETDDDTGEEEARTKTRFTNARVFDRAQVDPIPGKAKPLEAPDALEVAPIDGDSHAHLVPRLERIAAELGFPVERTPLGDGVLGRCRHGEQPGIALAPGQSPNGEVHTLIHELAHALGVRWRELGKPRAEAIVETVAYIACAEAGLDVTAAAVPYVAGWAADDPELIGGDIALIDEMAKWFHSQLAATDADAETADSTSDEAEQLPLTA